MDLCVYADWQIYVHEGNFKVTLDPLQLMFIIFYKSNIYMFLK